MPPILNYIANYIIQNKAYNQEFIDKHVNFTKTPTDIGYGLRASDPNYWEAVDGEAPTKTCIDCHKGIAHALPAGYDPTEG